MAVSTIPCRHSALTTSYTTNSYVSESDFNRITAYQDDNLVVVNGNLYITSTIASGTTVTIGKVNLPSTAKTIAVTQVYPAGGTGGATININTSGEITVGAVRGTASGWCRFNVSLPL